MNSPYTHTLTVERSMIYSIVNYGALMLKALFEYWPNSETMKAKQRALDEQNLKEQGNAGLTSIIRFLA